MSTVSVDDTDSLLSRLIDRALAGEEVVLARQGRPVVKLTPLEQPKPKPRQLGLLRGQFEIPDSVLFDPLPDDILEAFYGGKEGLEAVNRLVEEEAARHKDEKD